MTFLEYLEDLVDKAQANVEDYEIFYDKKLADLRNMNSVDSFLYGVASGKLDAVKHLRDLVTELMERFERP
jgi:hypothetical protein